MSLGSHYRSSCCNQLRGVRKVLRRCYRNAGAGVPWSGGARKFLNRLANTVNNFMLAHPNFK